MNKRKLATLVAASFAGLMLSSPSFATDADKKAVGPQENHQTGSTTLGKTGAPESRSAERADEKAAASEDSRNTEMKNQTDSNTPTKLGASESRSAERADQKAAVSEEDAAAAKADYEAAIQKCDALPSGERGSCVQDAKDAQSLAMNKGGDGSPATSGAPESRIVGPQSAK